MGEPAPLGPEITRVPPQAQPTIAEALSAKGISWKWYSGGRIAGGVSREYCSVCDPLIYSSAIMTGPLKANLQDHATLYRDIDDIDAMPAVAFVIPPNTESGHPASSTVSRYEEFIRRLTTGSVEPGTVGKDCDLVTVDRAAGIEQRYIRSLTPSVRIPLIAVPPSRRAHRSHLHGPRLDPQIHQTNSGA
jgi:phospholipase C